MNLRKIIEDDFLIDDSKSGEMVPFLFNPVQQKYYGQLIQDYGKKFWENSAVRELIIKARKEGFTSLILAIFATIMMYFPRRFLEISYRIDSTKQHFRRIKNFFLSTVTHDKKKWDEDLERKIFSSIVEGSEFVFRDNSSSFFSGTATSKTGERGGTVQGILFTESAHYPNTGIISASEIIEGTRNMVAVGTGMIFQETTGNGWNHTKRTWDMAKRGEVDYKPRFFGWREFYNQSQYKIICAGFSDKSLIPQEFPETADEAFLMSGRPVFNGKILKQMLALVNPAMMIGDLEDDEHEIRFTTNLKGKLTIWKNFREDKRYLISCDVAGGVPEPKVDDLWERENDDRAYSVAAVFDRSSWEIVAELRLRCDPGVFGRMLCTLGEYYNWAVVVPEANNHGAATLEAMKAKEYPHIFSTDLVWSDEVKRMGFPTNSKTKVLIISALRNAIESQAYRENSLVAIEEMMGANFDENGKMQSGGYLDCVISRAIGLYCLKFLSLDETYRNGEIDDSPLIVTSIVPKPAGIGKTGYR